MRVLGILKKAYSVRGRSSVRQWIEDTWVSLGGPSCVSNTDLKNAELLLDLIEQYSRGTSVINLEEFSSTKLNNLYAVPTISPDSVQIQVSTIHAAKGLEYDAVFIPRLDGQPGSSSNELMVWSEIFDESDDAQGSDMLVSSIGHRSGKSDDSNYRYISKFNKDKVLFELTRLAYVACTRAKKELYLYGEAISENRVPRKDSLLGCMWNGITNYHDQVDFRSAETEHSVVTYWSRAEVGVYGNFEDVKPFESSAPALWRLPTDWSLPPPPKPLKLDDSELEAPSNLESIDFDWAGSVAVWTGSIVHEWLRLIVQTGVDSWNADRIAAQRPIWKRRLLSMGMSADKKDTNFALKRIELSLINVLKDETGRWLLDGSHEDSDVEYRLTGYVDGSIRNVILDRTFVDDNNTRWIVDYKTGSTFGDSKEFLDNELKRYRDQLVLYKKIVSGMDSRPIRLGLYFPMFPDWRELIH